MSEMIHLYSTKLINSLLITLFFVVTYSVLKLLLAQRIRPKKRFEQVSIRLRYILISFFMIFFIKIWVEGFIQILAFVGFISAAITLTQKDTLMNLVGWLIINWRGLFHEEDYIRIANNAGFVKSIGPLYFTLHEASLDFPTSATGRVAKIPNGLVTRNPVVNYSHEEFVEWTVNFIFKPIAKFDIFEKLFLLLKEEMVHYIKHQPSNSMKETNTKSVDFEPKYLVKIRQEKPAGYEMIIMFYCKHNDKADLLFKVNKMIIDFTRNNPELALAFD
ncbi:MAG: hypothetical protein BGO43_04575 [Gammaproteobacteria bacterium 39-13]|nr:mechanosensitive ion channel family protein [Gammaproteobacteria bacterium]OJV94949.1 MAG: hypothetical protein BGO43_04575 [Gammaproteobacteria bacterium 39-13]